MTCEACNGKGYTMTSEYIDDGNRTHYIGEVPDYCGCVPWYVSEKRYQKDFGAVA